MKKTELKVGEEYAVFLSPGTARRFNNDRRYFSGTPLRVTLLEVGAVEGVWDRGSFSSTHSYKKMDGMKVTIPSNAEENDAAAATVPITIYESSAELAKSLGLKIAPKEKNPNAWNRGMRSATWTRDFLLLENAGCFVSTWADYEAREKANADATVERAARDKAEREANDAAAPAIEAKLQRVLARLADFGEVDNHDSYGEADDLHYIEVTLPNGATFSGEKTWAKSETSDRRSGVIAGAQFKLSLSALAALLEVE
jgi:hypothetical protein